MSDAKQPGAYVLNNGAGSEELVAPRSLAPKRANSAPPTPAASTPHRRAEMALERLSECGPDDEGPALKSLVALGGVGLAAVESTFPGLLWFHRHLAHTSVPRGRDCGPSCRVIAAFGDDAIPTLGRLLGGHDAARYYAVLLAADLLDTARPADACVLVRSLMERVLDIDRGVAEAAVQTLTTRRESHPVKAQGALFCAQLVDTDLPVEQRAALLKTLAVLRWHKLVPACVELLDDPNDRLRAMAMGGLRLMTAASPTSTRAWRRWLAKHGSKKRTTWLVDGLGGRETDCRKTAHQELVQLYGDSITYDVSMGWRQRRNAQRAFRSLAEH